MKKKTTMTEEAMEHVTGGTNEYGGAIYRDEELPNIPMTFNGGPLPEGTPQGGAIYSEGPVIMKDVQFTPPKETPQFVGAIYISH